MGISAPARPEAALRFPKAPRLRVAARDVAASPSLGYRAELDGVRALAVLAVIIGAHGGPFLPPRYHFHGGFLGVDVFFVLSGFLITTLLVEERKQSGRIRLRSFYMRRALRLLPALVVAVVLCGIVAKLLGGNIGEAPYPKAALLAVSYVGNWFTVFGGPKWGMGLIGHTWSLAVEEQYYLIWPAVLILCLRRGWSLRSIALACVALSGVVGVVRSLVFDAHGWQFAYFWTVTRADGVLLGSALALGIAGGHRWLLSLLRNPLPAIVGAGLVVWVSLSAMADNAALYHGRFSVVAVGAALCIGHLAVRRESLFARALRAGPLPAIGRMSYGLYLLHVPVMWWLAGKFWIDPNTRVWPGWALLVVGVAGSFVVAGLSYVLIERPALRLKARFGPGRGAKPRIAVAAVAAPSVKLAA